MGGRRKWSVVVGLASFIGFGLWWANPPTATRGESTASRAAPSTTPSGERLVTDRPADAAATARPRLEVAMPALRPPAATTRQGGLKLTFVVTADTHFGYGPGTPPRGAAPQNKESAKGIEAQHVVAIEDMNAIAGRAWPAGLSGRFGKPAGLLAAGDLTEDGRPEEWARFAKFYGHRGGDGLLDFPVYEVIGNHDKHHGWYVKERVAERHGGQVYSWDWHDVHVVALGEAPDDEDISWLRQDLARVGPERGVVVYFHFPLTGPFSDNWFGQGSYREHFVEALNGYNVLGIFHGHFHASGHYRYRGYDIYNVGSAKHSWRSFAAVYVDDGQMLVASWNFQQRRWWWWHHKPVFGTKGRARYWTAPGAKLIGARSRQAPSR